MSQILINSLSNVQDTVARSIAPKSDNATLAMDKSTDFKTALEKTLTKTEETLSVKDSPKTLGDIKAKFNLQNDSSELVTFRQILDKASSDANTETSLDLTLTKDVSELIAKFKEAIENAKNTELDSEEIKNIEVSTDIDSDDILDVNFDDIALIDEILNSEDLKDLENLESVDLIAMLSQLVSKIENTTVDFDTKDLKTSLVDKLTKLLDDLASKTELENANSTTDVLDMISFEKAEEVVVQTTKTPAEDLTQDSEIQLDEDILKELNIESIQAEAGNADTETFMQQQTAQEHVVKAMISQEVEAFDVKIEKTADSQPVQMTPTKTIDANPSKILNQVVKQMDNMLNGSKVNIVLNPESLGKVNIQLLSTKEGLMAQFTVTTPEAKDALMKGLDGLKESLLSHGVSVDNVSVKMSETQKSSYNPDWTEQEGSRGGNKEQGSSNKEEKEKGLFEKMMAQANEENGNV